MKPSDFIHPEDAAALRQLECIPGFATLLKKFYAIGLERMQYGINMASNIRLSEKQLPKLYNHLPPICKTFGIPIPEFYLQMDPMPNAWTFGDTRVFVTVTSGLVEQLNDEELDAVLAHECGHILCRHVIYHSLAKYIVEYAGHLGLIGDLASPLVYALLYWQRKSELSCDRAGALVTSPEVIANVMVRLSGGPKTITSDVNIKEWVKQADLYEEIKNDGIINKAMQMYATIGLNHPYSAVRVREIFKWGKTSTYRHIKARLRALDESKCPICLKSIEPGWQFCRHCGNKLK